MQTLINNPRLQALKNYYSNEPKFKTIEEARLTKGKYGNWITFVDMQEGTTFYACTTFLQKWAKEGNVYGNWNELTLIEKIK